MDKKPPVPTISMTISNSEKMNFSEKVESVNYLRQYILALVASLPFAFVGINLGWFGPTYLLLSDESSVLYVSSSQSAWVSGFLQIGAIPGPLIGTYITNKFGRQKGIYFTVLPNAISYILIYIAKDVYTLYAARFFAGIAVGISFVVIPIYISEIASPKIRGALGILMNVFLTIFVLMEYCIIPYVSLSLNMIVCMVLLALSTLTLPFIPETPHFHIANHREKAAEISLQTLRQKSDVSKELEELQQGWVEQKGDDVSDSFWKSLKSTVYCRAFVIIFGSIFSQQFSGCVGVLSYSQIMFKNANTSLSPEVCGIILNGIGLLMVLLSASIIDAWGRKLLFMASGFVCGVSMLALGFYFFLVEAHYDGILNYSLTPLIASGVYIFGYNIGLGSLPYIFVGELFPTHSRAIAGSIISILGSIFGLVTTLLYQNVADTYGVSYSFSIFAAFNFLSIIFGIVCIPETKGKTLEQIQKDLASWNLKKPKL